MTKCCNCDAEAVVTIKNASAFGDVALPACRRCAKLIAAVPPATGVSLLPTPGTRVKLEFAAGMAVDGRSDAAGVVRLDDGAVVVDRQLRDFVRAEGSVGRDAPLREGDSVRLRTMRPYEFFGVVVRRAEGGLAVCYDDDVVSDNPMSDFVRVEEPHLPVVTPEEVSDVIGDKAFTWESEACPGCRAPRKFSFCDGGVTFDWSCVCGNDPCKNEKRSLAYFVDVAFNRRSSMDRATRWADFVKCAHDAPEESTSARLLRRARADGREVLLHGRWKSLLGSKGDTANWGVARYARGAWRLTIDTSVSLSEDDVHGSAEMPPWCEQQFEAADVAPTGHEYATRASADASPYGPEVSLAAGVDPDLVRRATADAADATATGPEVLTSRYTVEASVVDASCDVTEVPTSELAWGRDGRLRQRWRITSVDGSESLVWRVIQTVEDM